MNKPPAAIHRRPNTVSRRLPRTRTEAAVELVRLEFDAARLERELEQAARRMTAASTALTRSRRRAHSLASGLARPEREA